MWLRFSLWSKKRSFFLVRVKKSLFLEWEWSDAARKIGFLTDNITYRIISAGLNSIILYQILLFYFLSKVILFSYVNNLWDIGFNSSDSLNHTGDFSLKHVSQSYLFIYLKCWGVIQNSCLSWIKSVDHMWKTFR